MGRVAGLPQLWALISQLSLSHIVRPVQQFLAGLFIREVFQNEVQLRRESVTFNNEKNARSLIVTAHWVLC